MANMERNSQQKPVRTSRLAYAKPALREFGPVGMLTQAGTGAMGENIMNPMNPRQRP